MGVQYLDLGELCLPAPGPPHGNISEHIGNIIA